MRPRKSNIVSQTTEEILVCIVSIPFNIMRNEINKTSMNKLTSTVIANALSLANINPSIGDPKDKNKNTLFELKKSYLNSISHND